MIIISSPVTSISARQQLGARGLGGQGARGLGARGLHLASGRGGLGAKDLRLGAGGSQGALPLALCHSPPLSSHVCPRPGQSDTKDLLRKPSSHQSHQSHRSHLFHPTDASREALSTHLDSMYIYILYTLLLPSFNTLPSV